MKQIILDTNFLLVPGQEKVDVFSEIEKLMDEPFELCVVAETLSELEGLTKKGKESDRLAAKLALVLTRQKSLKTLRGFILKKSADDAIVSRVTKDTFVATQDRGLKERVIKAGGRVIALRQKKYLVVV